MDCNEVGFICIISDMDANARTTLRRLNGVFISYTFGFLFGLIWIILFDDDDNKFFRSNNIFSDQLLDCNGENNSTYTSGEQHQSSLTP